MTIRQKGRLLMMASGKYYNWFKDKYIHLWSTVYPDCLRDKSLYDQSCLTTDLIELKPSTTITVEGSVSVSGNAAAWRVFGSDLLSKKVGYADNTFNYESGYKYIVATTTPSNYKNFKIYQDDELIFDGSKNPLKP